MAVARKSAVVVLLVMGIGQTALLTRAQPRDELAFQRTVAQWNVEAFHPSAHFDSRLRVTATSESGVVRRYVLREGVTRITDAFVHADATLVVVGQLERSVGIVSVLSLVTGQAVDSFWANHVAVSPDARFVAFTKFYSRIEPVFTDLYLLYDVTRSPSYNRMDGVVDLRREEDAGVAIYPDKSRSQRSYDLELYAEGHEHDRHSPLTWVTDTDLVFIDYYASEEKARLVRINAASGASDVRLQSVDFDASALVKVAAIGSGVDPAAVIFADSIARVAVAPRLQVRVTFAGARDVMRVSSKIYTF